MASSLFNIGIAVKRESFPLSFSFYGKAVVLRVRVSSFRVAVLWILAANLWWPFRPFIVRCVK